MKRISQFIGAHSIVKIVGGLLFVYLLLYSTLSIFGRYQPIAVSTFGVEQYAWAPVGFYDPNHAWQGSSYAVEHPSEKTGGWHHTMMWAFLPLWTLDIKFIHNQQRPPIPR